MLVCQNPVCAIDEGNDDEKERMMTMACCYPIVELVTSKGRLITSYLGQKESSLGHHVLIVAWAESKYYWYHFGILSGASRPKADISGKGVKEADLYPCHHLHCCVMLL